MAKKFAMCLLLGVVTTIAVAWLCAIFVHPERGRMAGSIRADGSNTWSYWVAEARGAVLVQRAAVREFPSTPPVQIQASTGTITGGGRGGAEPQLPQWSEVNTPPGPDDFGVVKTMVEDGRGWPRICMKSERSMMQAKDSPSLCVQQVDGGLVLRRDRAAKPGLLSVSQAIVLPVGFLWDGFLTNAAIYSAAWFVALFGPRLVRRSMRRARNACTVCGYDLRGTPAAGGGNVRRCPECGAMARA